MRRAIATATLLTASLLVLFMLAGCGGGGSSGGNSPHTPPPTGVPDAPMAVTATAVSGTRIDIAWSSVSGANSYSVYRGVQSGLYTVTVVAGTTATLVSDTTVSAGTTYYYVVKGANAFGAGKASPEVSATANAAGGSMTIQGVVKYEDKEYNPTVGHTGSTSLKAVRYADVELYSVTAGSAIASGATTSTGAYLFSVGTSSYLNHTAYVRVMASSTPVGAQRVNVKNLSQQAIYAVKTANFVLSGNASANLSIPVSNAADGAFNILDVFTSGFEFVYSYATTTQTTSLTAYWQPGNLSGTYYCPAGGGCGAEGIYVLSDTTYYLDTDEFDDDVLWHEFGHFVLEKFSRDDSPGGGHYLNDNTQDLRLSWSEGWGDYFQSAVKYWLYTSGRQSLLSAPPSSVPLSQYTDTEVGGIYLTINLYNPEVSSPYCPSDACYYASNEIAVASTLWHLMAEVPAQYGVGPIWDVVDNYMQTKNDVKLEEFWDGWLNIYGIGDLNNLEMIYSKKAITYSVDGYGAGESTLGTAIPFIIGDKQVHTLYTDPSLLDVDYVTFKVETPAIYTIQTNTLRNGADTVLALYTNTGTLIATNDNASGISYANGSNYGGYDVNGFYIYPRNDRSTLSSSITTTMPLALGDYIVSVQSSTSRPKSAGRYGSYTLTITTP